MDEADENRLGRDQSQYAEPEKVPAFRKVERHFWRRMSRGLLVIIPLLVTFLILRYLVAILENLLRPIAMLLLRVPYMGQVPASTLLAWLIAVSGVLAFLYVLGWIVTGERGQRSVKVALNSVLDRIPVVGKIYTVANQATEAISTPMSSQYSRVVFLDWPREGVRAMGLVTGQYYVPAEDRVMLTIYIATVPNPTSGMLAVIPEDEVIETDISVEDAMKIIFSGGIVLPDMMQVGDQVAFAPSRPGARPGLARRGNRSLQVATFRRRSVRIFAKSLPSPSRPHGPRYGLGLPLLLLPDACPPRTGTGSLSASCIRRTYRWACSRTPAPT